MTHPEDASAYLKAKLEDRNPKCVNCKHWSNEATGHPSVGVCTAGNSFSVITTQDLSLCSAWEKVTVHASDCAQHNEPAYPNGPCDCGAA